MAWRMRFVGEDEGCVWDDGHQDFLLNLLD